MNEIARACESVRLRIQAAASRTGRDPNSIRLIAVTKTVGVERIRQALDVGIYDIGENRLQEAESKLASLTDRPITRHFIGHLQTNKVRRVVELFDWIQSVDRVEVASKIQQYATRPVSVLIEVNLAAEATKSGVPESGLSALVQAVSVMPALQLRGLMTVPPFVENPEDVRPLFRRLRELGRQFDLPELSMGMSHDFEVAIEEGATMIRLGTALFGSRPAIP